MRNVYEGGRKKVYKRGRNNGRRKRKGIRGRFSGFKGLRKKEVRRSNRRR